MTDSNQEVVDLLVNSMTNLIKVRNRFNFLYNIEINKFISINLK